jgi:hypothetical protein
VIPFGTHSVFALEEKSTCEHVTAGAPSGLSEMFCVHVRLLTNQCFLSVIHSLSTVLVVSGHFRQCIPHLCIHCRTCPLSSTSQLTIPTRVALPDRGLGSGPSKPIPACHYSLLSMGLGPPAVQIMSNLARLLNCPVKESAICIKHIAFETPAKNIEMAISPLINEKETYKLYQLYNIDNNINDYENDKMCLLYIECLADNRTTSHIFNNCHL